jgi:tRNA (mo5U34)-methyltransferase
MSKLEDIWWWHSIELPDGTTTPGHCIHTDPIEFGLPEDLSGKTVLDVGAWDGLFSFEAERRGGTVTAIDIYQNHPSGGDKANDGFKYAKEKLQSDVTFKRISLMDVEDRYDVVLCYGVLYHLPDIFNGIRKLAEITKEVCFVETAVLNPQQYENNNVDVPLVGFFSPYHNDPTNFFYPNDAAMRAMAVRAGFSNCRKIVERGSMRTTYRLEK